MGWGLSGCPALWGEALLAHTPECCSMPATAVPPCRWAPGGVERHPSLQDSSLQLGRCDLQPKQPLSPSTAAPHCDRDQLRCLSHSTSLYKGHM